MLRRINVSDDHLPLSFYFTTNLFIYFFSRFNVYLCISLSPGVYLSIVLYIYIQLSIYSCLLPFLSHFSQSLSICLTMFLLNFFNFLDVFIFSRLLSSSKSYETPIWLASSLMLICYKSEVSCLLY
jgi:hypothetical protein